MADRQFDDTNRGVLFKNDHKDSPKHPDYKGKLNVGGREFQISAWVRDGRTGKFLSLSIQQPQRRSREPGEDL